MEDGLTACLSTTAVRSSCMSVWPHAQLHAARLPHCTVYHPRGLHRVPILVVDDVEQTQARGTWIVSGSVTQPTFSNGLSHPTLHPRLTVGALLSLCVSISSNIISHSVHGHPQWSGGRYNPPLPPPRCAFLFSSLLQQASSSQ